MARLIEAKTEKRLRQCIIHDQVTQLHLAAKEAQVLGSQSHACPHQDQEDQGSEMLYHYLVIGS